MCARGRSEGVGCEGVEDVEGDKKGEEAKAGARSARSHRDTEKAGEGRVRRLRRLHRFGMSSDVTFPTNGGHGGRVVFAPSGSGIGEMGS